MSVTNSKIDGKNKSNDIRGSIELIHELVKSLFEINSERIITEFSLSIVSKGKDDIDNCGDSKDNSVFINESNTDVIEVRCKSSNGVRNLLQYLDTIHDLNICMDKNTYDKFRNKFTTLYVDAFGNSIHTGWSYDTDEINKLLAVRNIGYRVIGFADGFYTVGLQQTNHVTTIPTKPIGMVNSLKLNQHITKFNKTCSKLNDHLKIFSSYYMNNPFDKDVLAKLIEDVVNIIEEDDDIDKHICEGSADDWLNLLLSIYNTKYNVYESITEIGKYRIRCVGKEIGE